MSNHPIEEHPSPEITVLRREEEHNTEEQSQHSIEELLEQFRAHAERWGVPPWKR